MVLIDEVLQIPVCLFVTVITGVVGCFLDPFVLAYGVLKIN